jgi:catechol 2,3-dioxygenase-like lactoylglutathione lyase family enzyme
MLVGVQDVHYCVQDMERAVGFYRDVLGMRVLDSNPWWTSLEFFGTRIGLRGSDGRALPPIARDAAGAHAGGTLTLRSTDLDQDVAYLRGRGVAVLAQSEHDWGRTAVFLDSEGNVLKLMQPPRNPARTP